MNLEKPSPKGSVTPDEATHSAHITVAGGLGAALAVILATAFGVSENKELVNAFTVIIGAAIPGIAALAGHFLKEQ